MRIFIVGKLGEVIKKMLELEDVLQEHPADSILIAEYAAYQEILKMWPIADSVFMTQATQIFKLNIAKLKQAEQNLRIVNNQLQLYCVNQYLKYLDAVREDLTQLNEIGMHIGPSPFLEVVDANMAQTEVKHPT